MKTTRLFIILALLVAGALLGTLGTPDRSVSLSSVFDLWRDAVRDVDQVPMRVTRVSDAEEMQLGASLAPSAAAIGQEDYAAAAYVSDVASRLLPSIQRPGIRYQFHVVDSPAINAFAMPGGQIFVMRGLLEFVESEAELASVLGHEISHVDLRHCIERYQYELKLKSPELEFMHRLLTSGFGPQQESDADAAGERQTVEADYDPDAAATLFQRMQKAMQESDRSAGITPGSEAAASVRNSLQDFFRSHPASADRSAALKRMTENNASKLRGQAFYVGKANLQQRIARAKQELQGEFRTY